MVTLRAAIALLLTVFLPCVHAELSVRLSSDSIEELESVRLVIRAHDTRRAEALDLTELEKTFISWGTTPAANTNTSMARPRAGWITKSHYSQKNRQTAHTANSHRQPLDPTANIRCSTAGTKHAPTN